VTLAETLRMLCPAKYKRIRWLNASRATRRTDFGQRIAPTPLPSVQNVGHLLVKHR